MMQSFSGWFRNLVNRAVYALMHPINIASWREYVRRVDPGVSQNELRRVGRAAQQGIDVAARATLLDPEQQLREALGPVRARAGAVEVEAVYEVDHATRGRITRSVMIGTGTEGNPQILWTDTMAELRRRIEDVEQRREPVCGTGPVDWDTLVIKPPMLLPPRQ